MKKESSFLCWICGVAVLIILFAPSLMANPVSKTTSGPCFISTSKAKRQIVKKLTLKAIEGFNSMFDFTLSVGVVVSSGVSNREIEKSCFEHNWISKCSIEVLIKVLKHELTHLLFRQWFKQSFPDQEKRAIIPNWFNEGIAVYNEGKSMSALEKIKHIYSISDLIRMPKLGYLLTRDGWYDKVYQEGALLVHYIAETRGKRKIGKFAELLSRGFSQTESLKKITDEPTLKAINSDFIAWIQNQRE